MSSYSELLFPTYESLRMRTPIIAPVVIVVSIAILSTLSFQRILLAQFMQQYGLSVSLRLDIFLVSTAVALATLIIRSAVCSAIVYGIGELLNEDNRYILILSVILYGEVILAAADGFRALLLQLPLLLHFSYTGFFKWVVGHLFIGQSASGNMIPLMQSLTILHIPWLWFVGSALVRSTGCKIRKALISTALCYAGYISVAYIRFYLVAYMLKG